jgi:hypothetical protein
MLSHTASVRRSRQPLSVRAASASCRLIWYNRAINGGSPTSWRLPFSEVQSLIREGAAAFNALRKAFDETTFRGQLETLELVVDKLREADDWTRRLGFFGKLDAPAKRAVTTLVREWNAPPT